MARRRGYRLRKSRARNPDHPAFDTYCLVDPSTKGLVLGDSNTSYGYGLEDCYEFLKEEKA